MRALTVVAADNEHLHADAGDGVVVARQRPPLAPDRGRRPGPRLAPLRQAPRPLRFLLRSWKKQLWNT